MSFVDNDEPELVADPRRPRDGTRVGGDRDRFDPVVAVADPTDRPTPDLGESSRPLIEQHARRDEHHRRDSELQHRADRHDRLAGAGR